MRFLTAGLLAAALLTVVTTDCVQACTAAEVINRGDTMSGTREYRNAERVSQSHIADPLGWTSDDALKAAVGTILIEAWDEDLQAYDHLSSEQEAALFLDFKASQPHDGTFVVGGEEFTTDTVLTHAMFHGQYWEEQEPTPPPPTWDQPDTEPAAFSEHGG
jgi:hypothetical protein